jgi:hypothetical protein
MHEVQYAGGGLERIDTIVNKFVLEDSAICLMFSKISIQSTR